MCSQGNFLARLERTPRLNRDCCTALVVFYQIQPRFMLFATGAYDYLRSDVLDVSGSGEEVAVLVER